MSNTLPQLRFNLDFLPSTDRERPGLYIRDPYHYSDATLLIPPPLVQALECFDGQQTTLDLRAELVRITGQIDVSDLEKHLYDSLDEAGFLETDRYRDLKRKVEADFAASPVRDAAFAGSAYPENPAALRLLLNQEIGAASGNGASAIAAPHASPDAAWRSYRAAYRELPAKDSAHDKVFVILATSHYGAPDHFGLTRKKFETPFGEAQTASDLVDELERAAPNAIRMEDYCYAVEHSVEFQVVFLQHIYGPKVKILPILCGPFVKSLYEGGKPEENPDVARFFNALGNMSAREGRKLFFVLGVDMAHMGQRYGDPIRVKAGAGEMLAVQQRDHSRIRSIEAGNIDDYWSLVQENHDDLKWCGSAPFYTYLRTNTQARGSLLHYDQWQIDADSVVTFGAMRFA